MKKLWIALLILFLINLILVMAPREYTRALRHKMVPLNMRVWAKGSLIHSYINAFLWQRGNGH